MNDDSADPSNQEVEEAHSKLAAILGHDKLVEKSAALKSVRHLIDPQTDKPAAFQHTLDTLGHRIKIHAQAAMTFGKTGWVITGNMPLEGLQRALAFHMTEPGAAAVESLLARELDETATNSRMVERARGLGALDDHLRVVAEQRARHIADAIEQHNNKKYNASTLLAMTQIDGIVRHATGKDPYAKNKKSHDAFGEGDVAGYSLTLARKWHMAHADEKADSELVGGAQRHGVLHGKYVAYDSFESSVKSLVMLGAVVEWAMPRMMDLAVGRVEVRAAAWAGSDKSDPETGWRRDKRGFTAARLALRMFATDQAAHRAYEGRYQTQSSLSAYSLALQKNSWLDADLQMQIEQDDEWLAYVRSESGWVFASWAGPENEVQYYDGPKPPKGSPQSHPAGWRLVCDGNWSGDCYQH